MTPLMLRIMKNKRTGGDEILTFFVDGKMPRSILVSAMTPDVVITFDGEMLSGFDKNKIKE